MTESILVRLFPFLLVAALSPTLLMAQTADLQIADAHLHYSHDSVEMTPPERVIEIMREANLKLALVSSSDDNGTQLLSELAPDLIVPGLRPYRLRGETGTWFQDPEALAYVEDLLEKNRYATIGEFHLFGANADLPIPRRIVELADKHNLILHAHSDADAVERLLAQNPNVKVLWAHSGFDSPEAIAEMLGKHDRLWADLAFRSEVGSGGSLSNEWTELFLAFPDRMMLGTDTYTPERMYYIPSHAESARTWLASLPPEIAENVAWKNASDLLMPVWEENRKGSNPIHTDNSAESMAEPCATPVAKNDFLIEESGLRVMLQPGKPIQVSEPASLLVTLCSENTNLNPETELSLDATMPAHGHGTNYQPEITVKSSSADAIQYQVDGVLLHMPGTWQWQIDVRSPDGKTSLSQDFVIQ